MSLDILNHLEAILEKRVFLGGTCNNSTWRNELIPMLNVDYFNPVVEDWTPECQEREIHERKVCTYTLYVLTPEMTGYYSIAEVIDDSHKKPGNVILCILPEANGLSFDKVQWKSLMAVKQMAIDNGAIWCADLSEVASYLNVNL